MQDEVIHYFIAEFLFVILSLCQFSLLTIDCNSKQRGV